MNSQKRPGILYILVGPGGVGKNALLNTILEDFDTLKQLPTATTRPIRPGEQQGREHHFVTIDEFQQMIDTDELVEYQEVHPGSYYGVPRKIVEEAIREGRDLIADIEVLGASIIRRDYPANSVMIFILPPSVDALAERMNQRGASDDDIRDRLARLPLEIRYAPLSDYVIVNDEIESAANQLRSLIRAYREGNTIHATNVKFRVEVIPVYGDEILCKPSDSDARPLFPSIDLKPDQEPERAALDALQRTLGLSTVNAENLRFESSGDSAPITITRLEDGAYQLIYNYGYHLSTHIEPPSGWAWVQGTHLERARPL